MDEKTMQAGTVGNEEAAAYLGCTPSTLRTWVSKRRVPHCRVGRLVRFRIRDLENFLDDRAVEPVGGLPKPKSRMGGLAK